MSSSDGDCFDVMVVDESADVVVAISGEVDVATAERLWVAVEDAMTCRPERLVIDLTDTTFIDARGLSVLARAFRALGRHRESLVVRGARATARKVFEITGIANIITLEDPTHL